MATTNRIDSLDIARGVMIILVVFFHASMNRADVPAAFIQLNLAFGGVRMPLLMLISGCLTSRLLAPGRSLSPRAWQMLWLFAIWTLVLYAGFAALNGASFDPGALVEEFTSPTTSLWFVWAIALMTLSLRPLRNVPPAVTIIVAALISIVVQSRLYDAPLYTYDHALRHGVFFYVGAYRAAVLKAFVRARPLPVLAILVPLLLATRWLDSVAVSSFGWQMLGLSERFIACLAVLQGSSFLAGIAAVRSPLVWIGRNTLPIFVAHPLFIGLAGWLPPAGVGSAIIIPVVTLFAVVGSLAVERGAKAVGGCWLYTIPAAVTPGELRRTMIGLGARLGIIFDLRQADHATGDGRAGSALR